MRYSFCFLVPIAFLATSRWATAQPPDLSGQVEIIRTAHGVPHIRAENLRAAGYALGWVQLEDYGARAAMMTLRARGDMGRVFGYDSIDSDFANRARHNRAAASYNQLEQATRDVYEGFAGGMNRYIELHPAEFPAHMPTNFVGVDIATRDLGGNDVRLNRIMAGIDPNAPRDTTTAPPSGESEDGSNAWAFAPSRTKSGHAILLRNPHLARTAGYYEAQITVPNVIDFYGDFRIGGPFNQVGGFNRYLGFATTNNAPELGEVYALDVRRMLSGLMSRCTTPCSCAYDSALKVSRRIFTASFTGSGPPCAIFARSDSPSMNGIV